MTGRDLYNLRRAQGVTLLEVAFALGLSRAKVSALETWPEVADEALLQYVDALGRAAAVRAEE